MSHPARRDAVSHDGERAAEVTSPPVCTGESNRRVREGVARGKSLQSAEPTRGRPRKNRDRGLDEANLPSRN